MRSELVFGAMTFIANRYLLARAAAKATRKLHRPNTRIQETMNDALQRFNEANPLAGKRNTKAARSLRRAA
jgi:hypothetical protein